MRPKEMPTVKTSLRIVVQPLTDTSTVAAVVVLASIFATGLHEHVGHALTWAALGSHVRELNAFYVDCDYQGMSDLAIRGVALAGPLMSLLIGLVAFALLCRVAAHTPHAQLLLWLLGSIRLFMATGYLLFSGMSGIGDFGVGRDGALYGMASEWLCPSLVDGAAFLARYGGSTDVVTRVDPAQSYLPYPITWT